MTAPASVPRTGARHPAGRGAASTLWGDGFAGDGFAALRRVRSWDEVSADEFVLPFPELVRPGSTEPRLLARLRSRLGVARLLVGSPSPRDGVARAEVGDWFEPSWPPSEVPSAPADLTAALASLEGRSTVAVDLDLAYRVAGLAGIHPAFLCPEGASEASRGVATCWLGWVARGRRALLHDAVLECLSSEESALCDDAFVAAAGSVDALSRIRSSVLSVAREGGVVVAPRLSWRVLRGLLA